MNLVTAKDPCFRDFWSQLCQADALQYPVYSDLNIEYQKEYFRDSQFIDVSFLVEDNRLPVAGVCAAVQTKPDGKRELSGYGWPMIFLQAHTPNCGADQRISKIVKAELDRLSKEYSFDSILHRDYFPTLSPVGEYLLSMGAKVRPHFTQIIDLSRSEESLHQQLRRSYQSLINWGQKNLELKLFDSKCIQREHLESFRQLHISVAGRQTRSQRTWDLQFEIVSQGGAFILMGWLQGNLVTASYYIHSSKYCYYGVSASKRELFDKPLSHSSMWSAILHARALGCRFFDTGEQLFAGQVDRAPTTKELSISRFKRGFGGQTVVRLDYLWNR
ncbi:MAG: hypothetical protein PHX83_14420 [Acidobacteriia bacterium]|nr:hypothetical protein [Terriglobia bacterium]